MAPGLGSGRINPMIDIHAHVLPDIDDGPKTLDEAVAMAEAFVADGVEMVVCTPHVWPPRYPNHSALIERAVAAFGTALEGRGIALRLAVGADVHLLPTIVDGLNSGDVPTLNRSRYFLLEPDHSVLTPYIRRFCDRLLDGGYIPVLTHPERLRWIEGNFAVIRSLYDAGVVMQVTAGALEGQFGSRPRYWADHMLEHRMIDVLASDAHGIKRRPPGLSGARAIVAERCGDAYAHRLVDGNPRAIVNNRAIAR